MKYVPKTTEWMRQNNWGAEAQQLVTTDLTSCESSLAEAEREIAALRSFVKDIATNYDHEECYHRNGLADTCCRQCKAEQLLNSEGRVGT